MDPEFLHDVWAPTVLVLATPDAEVVCRRNRLSAIDLLRPHGVSIRGLSCRQMGSEATYQLGTPLRVRFIALDQLRIPERDERVEALRTTVAAVRPADEPPVVRGRADVRRYLEFASMVPVTPWFEAYQRKFVRQLRYGRHETFDHPVAVVLVCSSSNPDPVAAFVQLFNPADPPALLQDGFMDRSLLKHHILVHDTADGPGPEAAEATFRKLKTVFGLGQCKLMAINSRGSDDPDMGAVDIWSQFRPADALPVPESSTSGYASATAVVATAGGGGGSGDGEAGSGAGSVRPVGAFLTPEDMDVIGQTVHDFVGNNLLPHLQKKVRDINEHVASSKKSWGGRWSRFIRSQRNERDVGPSPNDEDAFYQFNTQEAQLRLLADLSFFLQDYDFALSIYRLVQSDFKNARAWLYYAGAVEMAAVCSFLLEPNRDHSKVFEEAISCYSRSGNGELAARTTLFLYQALVAARRYPTAIRCMASLSSPSNLLLSAVALEQMAHNYLYKSPPDFRHYGHCMYQAAERFEASDQRFHAMRCYRAVLGMYKDLGWTQITDVILYSMARLSQRTGDIRGAILLWLELLACNRQHPETQQDYLDSFFKIIKKDAAGVHDLPLPTLDNSCVVVECGGYSPPPVGQGVTRDVWRAMEESVISAAAAAVAGPPADGPRVVRPGGAGGANRDNASLTRVVIREAVQVEFVLENPLRIELVLNDVRLFGVYEDGDGSGQPDAAGQGDEGGEDPLAAPDFECEPLDTVLEPGERQTVVLQLTPLREGQLRIQGIEYVLNNTVSGRIHFQLRGRRLNSTRAERTSKVYAEDRRLTLQVGGPMPFLRTQVLDFPAEILSGGVAACTLELRNDGERPMTNMWVKHTHGHLFSLGSSPVTEAGQRLEAEAEAAPGGGGGEEVVDSRLRTTNVPYDVSLMRLPIAQLDPGEVVRVPIWVEGPVSGKHNLHMLLYYEGGADPGEVEAEPGESNAERPFRLARISMYMRSRTSLRVRSILRPTARGLNEYVIGLEVENHHSTQFHLQTLHTLSPDWVVRPASYAPGVSPDDYFRLFDVGTRANASLFFVLSRASDDDVGDDNGEPNVDDGRLALRHRTIVFRPEAGEGAGSRHPDLASVPVLDLMERDKVRRIAPRKGGGGGGGNSLGSNVYKGAAGLAGGSGGESNDPVIFAENAIDLALAWTTTSEVNGKACGHCLVLGVALQHRAGESDPIKFHLEAPNEVVHDFAAAGVCVVPITFVYSNVAKEPVSFTFSHGGNPAAAMAAASAAGGSGSGGGGGGSGGGVSEAAAGLLAQQTYVWLGHTTFTMEDVAPGESGQKTLRVAFPSSARFDLTNYSVAVRTASGNRSVCAPRFTQFLTVLSAA